MAIVDYGLTALQINQLDRICPFDSLIEVEYNRVRYNTRSIDGVFSLVRLSKDRLDLCLYSSTAVSINMTTGETSFWNTSDVEEFNRLLQRILDLNEQQTPIYDLS